MHGNDNDIDIIGQVTVVIQPRNRNFTTPYTGEQDLRV